MPSRRRTTRLRAAPHRTRRAARRDTRAVSGARSGSWSGRASRTTRTPGTWRAAGGSSPPRDARTGGHRPSPAAGSRGRWRTPLGRRRSAVTASGSVAWPSRIRLGRRRPVRPRPRNRPTSSSARSVTTTTSASTTIRRLIFDWPTRRSRNVIGISRTRAPARDARNVISIWNTYPPAWTPSNGIGVERRGAPCLEAAGEVARPEAQDRSGEDASAARDDPPADAPVDDAAAARVARADDEIGVARDDRRDERRQRGRVVRPVGVHLDDDRRRRPPARRRTRRGRPGRGPAWPADAGRGSAGSARGQLVGDRARPVGRAVVDDQERRARQRFEDRRRDRHGRSRPRCTSAGSPTFRRRQWHPAAQGSGRSAPCGAAGSSWSGQCSRAPAPANPADGPRRVPSAEVTGGVEDDVRGTRRSARKTPARLPWTPVRTRHAVRPDVASGQVDRRGRPQRRAARAGDEVSRRRSASRRSSRQ